MADENDTPATETKPVPRRRASRKTASKVDAAKPSAAKRASRPATTPAKKPAARKPASKPASAASQKPQPAKRDQSALDKASDAVGGKRNMGLIAGGLAVAGAAAAALLSLRSSTPKRGAKPANDTDTRAHQPDGTDSSAQMDAMIADESMIPESTPKA